METIKKFLASALLTGLLLGTAAPVFAAVGETLQTTPVTSAITATYEVTIPASLAIDFSDADKLLASGDVVLNQLDAAGAVTVNAVASDLTLPGETPLANETLTTTLTNGVNTDQSIDFSLTNTEATQTVKVGTAELGKDNKPGAYTGSIVFSFDYLEAAAL